MNVTQLVPDRRQVAVTELLDSLSADGLPPFGDQAMELCAALSQAIFRDPEAREHAELTTLAYWLRKSSLDQLRTSFRALETPDSVLVPHGIALHYPPANVDTMFVYSWALALLAGNRNIVRLSSRETTQSRVLCRLLNEVAAASGGRLAANTRMVTYPHDDAITALLSAGCDLRVIWGGDRSVNAIRAIPLPPHARELTFPDRYSMTVMDARAVADLDPAGLEKLTEGFYNDLFWFDQMGCSSPRLVAWVGSETASGEPLRFETAVAALARRKGYAIETATILEKLTFAYGAVATRPVAALHELGNELTVLDLEGLQGFSTEHSGGGLLFQVSVPSLDALVPVIGRRFQTVTYFGIPPADLEAWVRRLNGRGVDRVVPVGQALQFHWYWDGYDLLQALTRRVHIVK